MSAKWIRSKKWDDEHFPQWAWPLKALLRLFSGIPLAVCLLSLVVLYAIMASVPAGLLVLSLTYIFYGLTLVVTIGVLSILPVAVMRRVWRPASSKGRNLRFAATLFGFVALAVLGAELWHVLAWPRLVYNPATGGGVRFFAEFVEQYKSTTVRRLPGVEMSELEFYSWWPLRVVLLLFVVNMITATVRRIEFSFPYIGVLSVHTGIVIIALGSVYYAGLKLEGDTILWSGPPGPDGQPELGEPQQYFYDNTTVALWVRDGGSGWQQRLITAPRYNDYNLKAGAEETLRSKIGRGPEIDGPSRSLDRPVPDPPASMGKSDFSLRIVGYASYAEPEEDWTKAPPPRVGNTNPVRFADLNVYVDDEGKPSATPRSVPFYFMPETPAKRIAKLSDDAGEPPVFGIEFTRGMPEERWADLAEELPEEARHGIVVEVPGKDGAAPFRAVYAVKPGDELTVGETGYTVRVSEITPQPPFPIITEGYKGATSSVAVVRITTPAGQSYDRWVYHRYPEISQDLLEELNERGMPKRRDADPAIRIGYIDASKLQVYVDEKADGSSRALIRVPGSPVRIVESVREGETIKDVMTRLDLRLGERWEHAESVQRPVPVPVKERRNDMIGNHAKAMLAVEITMGDWKKVVWLPHTRYLGAGLGTEREVRLPDGRPLTLAFGREIHPLPGFLIQLADFEMIAYDHRGAPRDYQSRIRVVPIHDGTSAPPFKAYTHITKLNAPLQAPFMWSDDRPYLSNMLGTFASRLNPRQFKFSQSGWDQDGWAQTQRSADQGQLKRPYAAFTIVGVGNNPGIHIIAFGAVLMSVGIPWAFYLKPYIMKRRRDRLAAEVGSGKLARPALIPAEPAGSIS